MHVGQLASILRAESALDQLPRRLGDFWLLREVGRGGMGVVYEAEQLSRQQRVAVKVLPTGAIGRMLRLQRFRHEIQAAAQLHHPHIVPVLAVSAEGESPHNCEKTSLTDIRMSVRGVLRPGSWSILRYPPQEHFTTRIVRRKSRYTCCRIPAKRIHLDGDS